VWQAPLFFKRVAQTYYFFAPLDQHLNTNISSLYKFDVLISLIVLVKDRKRRLKGGEWEPQISFEIFDRCPKITSSANEIPKAKIPKPTRDKSTKGVLCKVETQRNRQNSI
jgi:hypothetical protein